MRWQESVVIGLWRWVEALTHLSWLLGHKAGERLTDGHCYPDGNGRGSEVHAKG